MITRSFVILEKIGLQRERQLWQQGIKDWHDFLKEENIKGISKVKKYYYDRQIQEAQKALWERNSGHFVNKLPPKEMWRLYDHFKDDCGFLDIEIDSYGKISVVGISNYYQTNQFVQSINLNKKILEDELQKYKLMISFNGSVFDLPKLKKQLQLNINFPHIDLYHLCARLGLKGGLKEIERQLNLKRPAHLRGNPVDLWKAFHASGDREYLELLLEYNREDVENLKLIMEKAWKRLKSPTTASCVDLRFHQQLKIKGGEQDGQERIL